MNRQDDIAIGIYLANLREEQHLRQSDVAAKLKKPQSFVSKVESAERSLHLSELYSYAEALGVPEERLVVEIKVILGH